MCVCAVVNVLNITPFWFKGREGLCFNGASQQHYWPTASAIVHERWELLQLTLLFFYFSLFIFTRLRSNSPSFSLADSGYLVECRKKCERKKSECKRMRPVLIFFWYVRSNAFSLFFVFQQTVHVHTYTTHSYTHRKSVFLFFCECVYDGFQLNEKGAK